MVFCIDLDFILALFEGDSVLEGVDLDHYPVLHVGDNLGVLN